MNITLFVLSFCGVLRSSATAEDPVGLDIVVPEIDESILYIGCSNPAPTPRPIARGRPQATRSDLSFCFSC